MLLSLGTIAFELMQSITASAKNTWLSNANIELSLTTMRNPKIPHTRAFDYCAERSVKMLVAWARLRSPLKSLT
jgi:hypothetical protein